MDPTNCTDEDIATAPRRPGRRPNTPKNDKRVNISFIVSPETKAELQAEANRNGLALSRQIEKLVDEAILTRKLLSALGVTLEQREVAGSKLMALWKTQS